MHASGLLPTLVLSLLYAFVGGWVARALRLPPLIGYLLAGVAIGPFTPGFVADQKIAAELAEIGVALLLFGVGLHFSPKDLWKARRVALPGAAIQVTVSTTIGCLVARHVAGMPPAGAAIIGICLSIASTAVATRALAERGRLDTPAGRIALGWLVVQDGFVVVALVVVPLALLADSGASVDWVSALARVGLQILGFVAAMSLVGRRAIPWLLGRVARAGSRELFTLAVIVVALGIAMASTFLFGMSMALGAFVAGVVLAESDLSHQAAAETLPLQQVFTVLFFVSVGMLFDPMTLVRMPLEVAAMLATIVLGSGLVTLLVLTVLRSPPETAGLVGAAFAQIGEFSFIFSEFAVDRGLMDADGRNLVLAAALLSIVANPLMFRVATVVSARLGELVPEPRRRAGEWTEPALDPVPIEDHAILVGHGRVGSLVAGAMRRHGLPFLVVESDRLRVERLRAAGETVIYGDATRLEVLQAAAPARARLLVVALPDAFHARHVIATARRMNPTIETVVRTHSDQEAAYLESEVGVGLVVMGEREVALSMSDFALQSLGVTSADAQATVNALRGALTTASLASSPPDAARREGE